MNGLGSLASRHIKIVGVAGGLAVLLATSVSTPALADNQSSPGTTRAPGARGGGDFSSQPGERFDADFDEVRSICFASCEQEPSTDQQEKCAARCLQLYPVHGSSDNGLIVGGAILGGIGLAAAIAGPAAICNASDGAANGFEECEIGFLLGGIGGVLLGATLVIVGIVELESAPTPTGASAGLSVDSSGITLSF